MPTDNISSLYNINFQPGVSGVGAAGRPAGSSVSFDGFFGAALNAAGETNGCLNAASQAQLDLASGKTDDILSVMMAQEKAYSSLNLTVQVTNRVIEAYREIMRMQI